MKILTCNIRCFAANDGQNHWIHRKDLCTEVIKSRHGDIVCFQELSAEQFVDISAAFGDYAFYGMADTPVSRDPQNCIFYRRDAYALISAGGYWLSQSPHVAGSKSWDSSCIRLANWVRLEHRETKIEFRVINTHLDHISQAARENQARLIVEDSSQYPEDYPQILTGDMNCDTENPAIDVFRAAGWIDTYGQVHGADDPGHTYHGFLGPQYEATIGKMDWVLMRGSMEATAAEIITDSSDGRFPSDHYFVSATVRFLGA